MTPQEPIGERLARVETHLEHILPMVKDLHADHIRRKERGALLRTAIALGKQAPAALAGASAAIAVVWQHLPRM